MVRLPPSPGALAGRVEACAFESCTLNVLMNGKALIEPDTTDRMHESANQ